MQWSAHSLAALGCHASDLRSTDASASNVSSGHLDGTLPEVLIELPPRLCHRPSSSSDHRRCVHGRKGSPRCFCSAPDRGRTWGAAVGGGITFGCTGRTSARTHNQPSDL